MGEIKEVMKVKTSEAALYRAQFLRDLKGEHPDLSFLDILIKADQLVSKKALQGYDLKAIRKAVKGDLPTEFSIFELSTTSQQSIDSIP